MLGEASYEYQPERLFPTDYLWAQEHETGPRLFSGDFRTLIKIYLQDLMERRRSRVLEYGRGEGLCPSKTRRVVVYAHFSESGRVSSMVISLLSVYAAMGYSVLFVTMCSEINDEDGKKLLSICSIVFRRRSFGRDFGAWKDVLSQDDVELGDVDELILTNDSVLGPIRPIQPAIEFMRRTLGVWGMTNSLQCCTHLQSYFIMGVGRPAVRALMQFLNDFEPSTDKQRVIISGELTLSLAMISKGLPVFALFPVTLAQKEAAADRNRILELGLSLSCDFLREDGYRCVPELRMRLKRLLASTPINPTIQLADILVTKMHFPFVKCELLQKNPCQMSFVEDWRSWLDGSSTVGEDMILEHLCLSASTGATKP